MIQQQTLCCATAEHGVLSSKVQAKCTQQQRTTVGCLELVRRSRAAPRAQSKLSKVAGYAWRNHNCDGQRGRLCLLAASRLTAAPFQRKARPWDRTDWQTTHLPISPGEQTTPGSRGLKACACIPVYRSQFVVVSQPTPDRSHPQERDQCTTCASCPFTLVEHPRVQGSHTVLACNILWAQREAKDSCQQFGAAMAPSGAQIEVQKLIRWVQAHPAWAAGGLAALYPAALLLRPLIITALPYVVAVVVLATVSLHAVAAADGAGSCVTPACCAVGMVLL